MPLPTMSADQLINLTGGAGGIKAGDVNPFPVASQVGIRKAGQSGIMKLLGKANPLTMFVGDMVFPEGFADGTLDAARAKGLVR